MKDDDLHNNKVMPYGGYSCLSYMTGPSSSFANRFRTAFLSGHLLVKKHAELLSVYSCLQMIDITSINLHAALGKCNVLN